MKEKGRVQARAFGGTRNKYRARKVVVDGETFDSQREYKRWQDLKLLERAGDICGLQRQVTYTLAPPVKIKDEKRARPALRYTADFVYLDGGIRPVVEDAKGFADTAFRMRQHLMKSVHGIDVRIS